MVSDMSSADEGPQMKRPILVIINNLLLEAKKYQQISPIIIVGMALHKRAS
jgi:hypothetical protein